MSKEFEHLQPEEVISVEEELRKKQRHVLTSTTFQTGELIQKLADQINTSDSNQGKDWLFNGIDCKVLKFSYGRWVKGTLKLALEFYPDEPEIPEQSKAEKSDPDSLDDLRKELNQ